MNFEIKKILVPVDFSETSEMAMFEAIGLAILLKADIFLLHVMEYNMHFYSTIPEMQLVLPATTVIERSIITKMENIQKLIEQKYNIKPEIYVASGNIYVEILDFSKKKEIDLIVMGTHGASGIKELFIGTNAQRVVTLSEVPVLTMRKKISDPHLTNILIPIDNSIHSREKVQLAMTFANLFKAKIHIIGFPDSTDEQDINKFNIKIESVEKIIKLSELSYVSTIIHGSNLADAAIDYASKNNCDLIVINTGHESKLTGIFMGVFAQQIVNHSEVPVLSFKHSHGHFSIDTVGFGIN
jgi:nucleotide-binding universal stress UspA family protein